MRTLWSVTLAISEATRNFVAANIEGCAMVGVGLIILLLVLLVVWIR